MQHRIPGADSIWRRERRGKSQRRYRAESKGASNPATIDDVLHRGNRREDPERRDSENKSAVQIRPQREHRNREPELRATTINLACKQVRQRAKQSEGEHLRPELNLRSYRDGGRDQSRELNQRG